MNRDGEALSESELDPWLHCENSRLLREDCRCLTCFPWIHRFKWMCVDAKTIGDVIKTLDEKREMFVALKEAGYTIGGPIEDDYMEIHPPEKKGYYWARCSCGRHYATQEGVVPPRTCDQCDLEGRTKESDKEKEYDIGERALSFKTTADEMIQDE